MQIELDQYVQEKNWQLDCTIVFFIKIKMGFARSWEAWTVRMMNNDK